MEYLGKVLKNIIGSDDDTEKRRKKDDNIKAPHQDVSIDVKGEKVTQFPMYKAVIYNPLTQKELLLRKAMLSNFSDDFMKDLEAMAKDIVKYECNRSLLPIYYKKVEDMMVNKGLILPFSEYYIHPLFRVLKGSVVYDCRDISLGKEESFGNEDIASLFLPADSDNIFIMDASIQCLQSTDDRAIEVCMQLEEKKTNWIGFHMDHLLPAITLIDKGFESNSTTDSQTYIGVAPFKSLYHSTSMAYQRIVTKNNLWNLYLGDKSPRFMQDHINFLPTDNQPFDSGDGEHWVYIAKNFFTFLALVSIIDTLQNNPRHQNLCSDIQNSMMESVGGYYRLDQKSGEMVNAIIISNMEKTNIKKISFRARLYDYALEKTRFNQTESLGGKPIRIKIDYEIIYRNIETLKILQNHLADFQRTVQERKETSESVQNV